MAAYEQAVPVLLETDEVAAGVALTRLSSAYWALGADGTRDTALRAIEVLTGHPGPELVRAYGSAALSEAIAGRYADAEELLDAGLAMAHDLGIENIVTLLHARASVRGYQGDARCVDDVREARDHGLRLGLGRDTAISMNNLGDAQAWYVDLPTARETWEQAIAFSVERGLTGPAMWQRGERLRCLYHAGEWDSALAEASEVLAWELETGAGPLEVYARLPMAGIAVHRGDVRAAEAHVDALVAAARKSGDPQVLFPGLSMAALVASAAGNVPSAVRYIQELERGTRDQPAWRSFCRVEPLRVAVALVRPDLGEAFLGEPPVNAGWDACAYPLRGRCSPRRGGITSTPPRAIGRQARCGASTAACSSADTRFSGSAGAAMRRLRPRPMRSLRDSARVRFSPRLRRSAAGIRAGRCRALFPLGKLGRGEGRPVEDIALGDLDLG